MHHAVRLLLGLAALTAAGAAFAHAGIHVHTHPHLGLDVLLVMLVGGTLGALHSAGVLGSAVVRQRPSALCALGVAICLIAGWLLLMA